MKIAKIVENQLNYLKINKVLGILFLILWLGGSDCFSQTILKGYVYDKNQKSIPFVNVLIHKDSSAAILSFAYSDDKGKYQIKTPAKGNYRVTFSSLGYETQSVLIEVSEFSTELIQDIVLTEKPYALNEVIVMADQPIKVKKDTIVFDAQSFATGNEEVVEDLLKKIPGVSVDQNGTIRVGNQEIEKLMVDGDDFFERGYKILSKNMPPHPIDKVEILNNYSKNHLLKNIEKSDKVALNLKLKEKFKRVWFGNTQLAYDLLLDKRY
jgi:hypothetical protein